LWQELQIGRTFVGKRVNVEKGNVRRNETRSMINKPTTRDKERERERELAYHNWFAKMMG
jgi:hypothetical protein